MTSVIREEEEIIYIFSASSSFDIGRYHSLSYVQALNFTLYTYFTAHRQIITREIASFLHVLT